MLDKRKETEAQAPAVTFCRKCLQPVELEVIPGSQRVEECISDQGFRSIKGVADYSRRDLCFYHRKMEEGLMQKTSTVSRNDGALSGGRRES